MTSNTALGRIVRFVAKALLLGVVVVGALAPQPSFVAKAQQEPPSGSPEYRAAEAQVPAAERAAQQAIGQQQDVEYKSCWSLNWGVCAANIVYVFTVGLMSIFAYIGSFIFNLSLQLTLQSVTYSQSFVTIGWSVVRDFANMAFIFILIYLAITIVLRAETANTSKLLAGIIAAALLINFSFFITRVVIDAGNLLAVQFYNAIDAPSMADSGRNDGVVGGVQAISQALSSNEKIKDLSAGIMGAVGVQSLLGNTSFQKFAENSSGWVSLVILFFVYIATGALLAMLAFAFIAVGIKFFVRIAVLWFTIIASPAAFVAGALFSKGKLDGFGYFKQWRSALIEFSFYPAIFLFLFLIINIFTFELSRASGGQNILYNTFSVAGAVRQDTGSVAYTIATAVGLVTVRVGIILAMLYLAIQASNKFAKTGVAAIDSYGTQLAGKFTGWTKPYLTRFAKAPVTVAKAPFKVGQSLAYRGAGNLANTASKKLAGARWANNRSVAGYAAYRMREGTLASVMAAKPSLGGKSYKDAKDASEKWDKERKANLRSIDNKDQVADHAELSKKIIPLLERDKAQRDLAIVTERLNDLNGRAARGEQLTAKEQADQRGLTERSAELSRFAALTAVEREALNKDKARLDTLTRNINDLSKNELEKLGAKEIEKIVSVLKESQLKRIEDSDKFSEPEKDSLRNLWNKLSKEAALEKSHAIIEQLREANATLHRNGDILEEIDQTIGSRSLPVRGTTIDSSSITRMSDSVSRALDLVNADIRAGGTREVLTRLNTRLRTLQAVKNQLDKLNEERGKVPAGATGDGEESGKFKTR